MSLLLIALPLIGALVGYLMASLGIRLFIRSISRRRSALSAELSHIIATRFLSINELQEKLVNYDSFRQLMPTIEEHIDEFLHHKLNKAMPFLGMFVGEKTIKQLKDLFMEELAVLFPVIMKNYVDRLQQDVNPEQLIRNKLDAIDSREFKALMSSTLSKELGLLRWMGAVTGIIIGLIEVFILLIRF